MDIDSLYDKFLKGELNPEEEKQLLEWLGSDLDREKVDQFMLSHWQELQSNHIINQDNQAYFKIRSKILENVRTQSKGRNSISNLLKITASVSVILLATWILFLNNTTEKDIITIETFGSSNAIDTVFLPDGSMVWLNSNSKISYASDFEEYRNLTLEGEAYFDVQKGKSPFIVYANNIGVKVLGTQFNLRSYSEDSLIETVLVEGALQVFERNIRNANTVENISPFQVATYIKSKQKFVINNVSETEAYTAWRFGKLIFKQTDLITVAKRLEDWYSIKIIFKNPDIKNYRITGTIKNESIEQVLSFINESIEINYDINDNVVIIY